MEHTLLLIIIFVHDSFLCMCRSLGLAISPRVRFIQKEKKRLEEKLTKKSKQSGTHDRDSTASSSSQSILKEKVVPSASGSSDFSEAESNEENVQHTSDISTPKHDAFDFGGGDDDDDEIFTVKKKEDQLVISSSESDVRYKCYLGRVSFCCEKPLAWYLLCEFCYLQSSEDDTEPKVADRKKKKEKSISKAALAKKLMKKNITTNVRVVFDDEGQVRDQ